MSFEKTHLGNDFIKNYLSTPQKKVCVYFISILWFISFEPKDDYTLFFKTYSYYQNF